MQGEYFTAFRHRLSSGYLTWSWRMDMQLSCCFIPCYWLVLWRLCLIPGPCTPSLLWHAIDAAGLHTRSVNSCCFCGRLPLAGSAVVKLDGMQLFLLGCRL